MLDPACGSGNFLYLALHALKDIEHRIQLEAETLGLERGFPAVGPANVRGIEINAYAAELARVSVWIGEIQWMRRNGFSNTTNPILDPLDTIECRDAIIEPEGSEPDWPQADVVIGNPPFLGGKLLIGGLSEEYVTRTLDAWKGRVPPEADLVCYWFVKAGEQVAAGATQRVGLVATNSIRGGANRRALQAATDGRPIFDAWADEPWVIDGAAVRVSLICFSGADDKYSTEKCLNGEPVDEIHSDLTGRSGGTGIDLTGARRIPGNSGVAFMGDTKGGPFDVPGDVAREWLGLPANPNGRSNADVLKPWVNGMDLTRRPAGKWIVDFGWNMSEAEAALYEAPFEHVKEHVWPMRQRNRREAYRVYWVAACRAETGFAPSARWSRPLHRYSARSQASTVRLAGRSNRARQRDNCHFPRRQCDLRHPAQPVSRGVVAATRHMARQGQRSALHPDHHFRDVPIPGGPHPRHCCGRVRGRAARRRHWQRSAETG